MAWRQGERKNGDKRNDQNVQYKGDGGRLLDGLGEKRTWYGGAGGMWHEKSAGKRVTAGRTVVCTRKMMGTTKGRTRTE